MAEEERIVMSRRPRTGSWVIGLGTAALVLTTAAAGAGAAAPASNFASRYAQYSATETQLLQQAAAAGASTTTAAFASTVQTINAQVAALYAAEQVLASAKTGIPAAGAAERAKLRAEQKTLTRELRQVRSQAGKGKKGLKAADKRDLKLKEKIWTAQLKQVAYELAHPALAAGNWKRHPYDHGLSGLQQSILTLQQSAIHYTQLWITAAKAPAPTGGTPATITGLAYAQATIAVPASGSPAATDAVATMPVVRDAQSNVLADAGTFSIAGPTAATGVAVDSATGQVSVSAGATLGTYVVTYTQGSVSESVNLTVSQ